MGQNALARHAFISRLESLLTRILDRMNEEEVYLTKRPTNDDWADGKLPTGTHVLGSVNLWLTLPQDSCALLSQSSQRPGDKNRICI